VTRNSFFEKILPMSNWASMSNGQKATYLMGSAYRACCGPLSRTSLSLLKKELVENDPSINIMTNPGVVNQHRNTVRAPNGPTIELLKTGRAMLAAFFENVLSTYFIKEKSQSLQSF
jgi:hypothetical protein